MKLLVFSLKIEISIEFMKKEIINTEKLGGIYGI